jgi:hypothetical protein
VGFPQLFNGTPRAVPDKRNAPRVRPASLEGYAPPRARSSSLEGLTPPQASSASLEALTPPRAGSASLEGSTPPPLGQGPPRSRAQHPLGEDRLTRGHLHARRPRSCPRVQAFNALTPQDARHNPGTPGNRVPALFHQLPGGGHPHRCVTLCDEAGVSSVTLCRLPPYG